jgi:RND family efflux transporter MFP subunit
MKKHFFRILTLLIILFLMVAAVLLVRHRKSGLADQATPEIRPLPVVFTTPDWGVFPLSVHELGVIEPLRSAVLSAQISGELIRVHKDVGDRVRQGEILADIDPRLTEARKQALSAELAGARQDLDIKTTIRDRRRALLREQAIAMEALDEAELAASLALSRVLSLEQDLMAADLSLSFARMTALVDGVVTERMKDPGDLVGPGTPVLRIEDPGPGYRVLVRVSQNVLADLVPKAAVTLTDGDRTLRAAIDRIHPAIVSGHLTTVEIRTPTRPFDLPSHATVGVILTTGQPEGWRLSARCLLETDTGTFVFALNDQNRVSPRPVTVIGRAGDRAVVTGELSETDRLVTGPEFLLLKLDPAVPVVPVSEDAP